MIVKGFQSKNVKKSNNRAEKVTKKKVSSIPKISDFKYSHDTRGKPNESLTPITKLKNQEKKNTSQFPLK